MELFCISWSTGFLSQRLSTRSRNLVTSRTSMDHPLTETHEPCRGWSIADRHGPPTAPSIPIHPHPNSFPIQTRFGWAFLTHLGAPPFPIQTHFGWALDGPRGPPESDSSCANVQHGRFFPSSPMAAEAARHPIGPAVAMRLRQRPESSARPRLTVASVTDAPRLVSHPRRSSSSCPANGRH